MSARTKKEIGQILKQVQARLDAKRVETGIALKVPKDGYTQDEDWLHVLVSPAAEGIRAYDYVKALGQVESELRNTGIDHVVLVPALAD